MGWRDVVVGFWKSKPCRLRPRDEVVVDGGKVSYLLWDRDIAVWNRDADTLIISDCGWQTRLTSDRLNYILSFLHCGRFTVYSYRRSWRIKRMKNGFTDTYYWQGTHTINLQNGGIQPAKPVKHKRNRELSKWMEKVSRFYWEDRRFYEFETLTGNFYVLVERLKRGSMTWIVIQVEDGKLPKILEGIISASAAYKAVARGRLSLFLKEPYQRVSPREALTALRMIEDIEKLPEPLERALALTALLA